MPFRRGREQDEDRRERCQWVRCRQAATVIYLEDGLCEEHWRALCAQQERDEDRQNTEGCQ